MAVARLITTLSLAAACGCAAPAPPPAAGPASRPAAAPGAGAAAWKLMQRSLPGAWTMPGKKGPFTVAYKLISGDSALVETWGVGSAQQTMTVFHPDHADLMLTHYCAQGNQPRLYAVSTSDDTIVFRFADATNLGPGQAVLIERTLHFRGDAFDDTEVYKQPDGSPESTTYHFARAAPPATSP